MLGGCRSRTIWLGAALAVGVALLAGGLQLEERVLPAPVAPGEVTVLPQERPLWIHFPGAPLTAVKDLRLDGRGLFEPPTIKFRMGRATLSCCLARMPAVRVWRCPVSPVAAQVGDYRWAWRWEPARFSGMGR